MFNFYERKELKKRLEELRKEIEKRKENEKLKKENEELRRALTGAVKRNEELWDALNRADSQMYAFAISSKAHYVGDDSPIGRMLKRWSDKFDEQYKAYEDRLFHSEYKGLHKCGDERYWFK